MYIAAISALVFLVMAFEQKSTVGVYQTTQDSLISYIDSLQHVDTGPRDLKQERDSLVLSLAQELQVPPTLALAIARVENPRADSMAISPRGAVGLMQVRAPGAMETSTARVHRRELVERICGDQSLLFERMCNIRVGLMILKDYLRQHDGDWDKAQRAYNGALHFRTAGDRYVAKVQTELDKLEID